MEALSSTCRALCLAILGGALSLPAQATLLMNGGFEAGLAGWTSADQVGSEGGFMSQTGLSSPVNGLAVPAPPEGSMAAMTDAMGPGSHVLYQDFVVPTTVVSASAGFSLFINNTAEDFFVPNPQHLDWGGADLNQQARVDLMTTSVDPFSLDGGVILLTLYQTNPGDALVSGYTDILTDVTALFQAHAGQTLRLRFAEVDNVFIFNIGIDDVVVDAVIPEPSSWILMSGALGFGAFLQRRRSAADAA